MNSTIILQSFQSGIVQQITVATVSQTGERGPKGDAGAGLPDIASLNDQDFLRYNQTEEDFEAIQLGSAAYSDSTEFATSAEGDLANTALQSGDPVSDLTNDANYIDSAGAPVQSVDGFTGAVDLSGEYDALGSASSVQGNLTDHENATTNVHGIANTDELIVEGDSRLTNERVPQDESVTDAKIESGGLAPSSIAGIAVVDSDSRLSDERTPTDGSVDNSKVASNAGISQSKIDGLTSALDAKANDSEISTVGKTGDYSDLSNKPDLSALEEVLAFSDLASFPASGESGKVYIAEDTGYMYRWSGSAYVQLTDQTAIWGQVSGTLSNQTDLQDALDDKADNSTTITGGTGLTGGGDLSSSRTIDLDSSSVTSLGLADTALQSGDNVSELTNDSNYIDSAGAPVQSVNGDTGAVVLDASDLSFDNSGTNLTATLVQTAIDELDDKKINVSDLSASVKFFATSAAGAVAGYGKLVIDTGDADFDDPAVAVTVGPFSGSDNLLGSLVSDAGVLVGNTTSINVTTIGNVRRSSGNQNDAADFYFAVYKRESGGTETLIGTSSNTKSVSSDAFQEFFAGALIDDTNFTETDRVVVKFYGNVRAGGGGETYEFQYGGNQPVRTLFPVPITVVPTDQTAAQVQVDASGFAGLLSNSDDDVQAAFETLDQSSLNDLSNVVITSPQAGDVLQFDGTNWVNVQLTDTDQDFYTVSSS